MSHALARRVYCRIDGTPAEGLLARAQVDPDTRVGRIGDAVLLYPGPEIAWSTVIGAGLDDTPADVLVAGIDAFFGPVNASPELLLTPYTRPDVLAAVRAVGFRLIGMRHLLHAPAPLQVPAPPPGLTMTTERVPGLVARGFKDGADPRPVDVELEATLGSPGNVASFTAWIDGQPAGGGRVAIHDGVALLFGASVLPDFRRRGVQAALLVHRVDHARRAGADLIVVESTDGGPTARNALRLGFEIAFTNAIFKCT